MNSVYLFIKPFGSWIWENKVLDKLDKCYKDEVCNDEVNKVYKHDIDFKIEQTRNTKQRKMKN